MASSKSSQTTRNIIIACLALWSVISLITIVVWATSPDMKGASQCRAELHTLQVKFDEEKAAWAKDRWALEDMVRQGWINQTTLQSRVDQLNDQLKHLNVSLDSCLEENANLRANITSLESEIELHKAIEANLTAEISQQQDLIENLNLNLTQTINELASCTELTKAAQLLQSAAEKQRDACKTKQQYTEKQLIKCQKEIHPEQFHGSGSSNDGAPGPTSGVAMLVVVCVSLLLIPYRNQLGLEPGEDLEKEALPGGAGEGAEILYKMLSHSCP